MCTVSFIAQKNGYALAMNRDEQVARLAGLPPKTIFSQRRKIICPSEPGGGTWIALNDAGVSFALINWYSVPGQVEGNAISRGNVVKSIYGFAADESVALALEQLPLKQIKPFRLIAVFRDPKQITEWRWDLNQLARQEHPWESQQWISSGYDEPMAQLIRSRTFLQSLHRTRADSLAWLRRLHRSHAPQPGPFSICMHRDDAVTVSYTEISVGSSRAAMRYHPCAPCTPVAPDASPRQTLTMGRPKAVSPLLHV